ncbi:MAG: DUF4339 domain-containing protein [Alloprevotella sp.]|nr:DUF4339 domain-containing protein [Alloprevotella sp.]
MSTYRYINAEMDVAGPMTADEMAAAGITDDTLVWHEGMDDFLPAHMIPEVAEALRQHLAPQDVLTAGLAEDTCPAAGLPDVPDSVTADVAPADMSIDEVNDILCEMEGRRRPAPLSGKPDEPSAPDTPAMPVPPPPPPLPLRTTPPPPPPLRPLTPAE